MSVENIYTLSLSSISHSYWLLNFFVSIVTNISVTGMAVAKKNPSQIDKLVAVAAVACKLDHATQKMPNRDWSVIADDMHVLERRIRDLA